MSFPHYLNYKSSGVEWLGNVPEHWRVTLTKRYLTVQSGDMISASEETEAGYPIVGGNGFRAYTDKFNTPSDTLVIGRVGALCGCVHHLKTEFWASEHAYRVIEKQLLDKRFFFYLLSAIDLNKFAIKTAQPLLNTDIVETQWIAVPELDEQQELGAFLDSETAKIDVLVEEQKRLIELLKEKRQTVITQAVTKGLDPNTPMKSSGVEWLGEVPAHWEVTRLGHLFREVTESGSEELPILSVSIHDGVSDSELDPDELERKVTRSEDRTKYKRVAPADLAYNMMRAWQGGFGTVMVDGMVSPAYVVARPKRQLATDYIELILRTPMAVEEMRRHSRGITDFRLRLYWEEFKTLNAPFPPYEEQLSIRNEIDQITGQFVTLSNQAERAIALLQERRSALVTAAVTGKIDVRAIAAKQEAA